MSNSRKGLPLLGWKDISGKPGSWIQGLGPQAVNATKKRRMVLQEQNNGEDAATARDTAQGRSRRRIPRLFSCPSSLSPETKPSWEPANRGVGKWSLQGLVTTPSPSTFSSPLPPPMLQSKAEEEQGKDLNVNWPRIALEGVNRFPTPPPLRTCPCSTRMKRSSR